MSILECVVLTNFFFCIVCECIFQFNLGFRDQPNFHQCWIPKFVVHFQTYRKFWLTHPKTPVNDISSQTSYSWIKLLRQSIDSSWKLSKLLAGRFWRYFQLKFLFFNPMVMIRSIFAANGCIFLVFFHI